MSRVFATGDRIVCSIALWSWSLGRSGAIAQECNYDVSGLGLKALQVAEGVVSGCYLDDRCYWTAYSGHLVSKNFKNGGVACLRFLAQNPDWFQVLLTDTSRVAKNVTDMLVRRAPKRCVGRNRISQGFFLFTRLSEIPRLYKERGNYNDPRVAGI